MGHKGRLLLLAVLAASSSGAPPPPGTPDRRGEGSPATPDGGNLRWNDHRSSNRHRRGAVAPAVDVAALLEEARPYLSEEALSAFDLSLPADVEELRREVDKQQAKAAVFNFGYSVQV